MERLNNINNPLWPPKIGKVVMIINPKYSETFVGRVLKTIWNETGAVIVLLNHRDYVENVLANQNIVSQLQGGKGLYLLLPTHGWKYIDDSDVTKLTKSGSLKESDHLYQMLSRNRIPEKTYLGVLPPDADLMVDKGGKDVVKEEMDLMLEEEYFAELKVDNYDERGIIFTPPSKDLRNKLKEYLEKYDKPKDEDIKILVNKSVAVDQLIKTKDDAENESNKIIKFIDDNFGQEYIGLEKHYQNGIIYLSRKGIDIEDEITPDLVPNLSLLAWQYGKPINYHTLKYLLFQNDFQKTIEQDKVIQEEAEKILSQEFLIMLHPRPEYFGYVLKRFIKMWYADVDLQNLIRKVRILPNFYRGRSGIEYNQRNGILPLITIYPKYGRTIAKTVLTKITNYFTLYQRLGWKGNSPSYSIQINELIYYANASTDLKLYFRKVLQQYDVKVKNNSFTDKLTRFEDTEDILDV